MVLLPCVSWGVHRHMGWLPQGTVVTVMTCEWFCRFPVFADIYILLFVATVRISPQSLIGISVIQQISDFGVVDCCV